MRKFLKYGTLPAMALLFFAIPASSQQTTSICVRGTNSNNGNSCVPVDATNPFPVTGSSGGAGGNSAVTVTSVLPTISTATAVPTASKAGAAYVQPVFDSTVGGGKYVGTGTGLPVDIRQINGASIGTGIPVWATALPLPSNAAQESGGNLATLAGGVSGSIYQENIKQVNGASIGTGVPIWATSLNVNSGNIDGTSKTGLQYSGVAGVAETTATACAANTQCYVRLDPNNRALGVDNTPVTAGGLSVLSTLVAQNQTAVAVDASPGQVYKIEAYNNAATIGYLSLYDVAQGSVTCGIGSPKIRMMIPANSTSGAGVISMDVFGLPFTTAITQCVGTIYGGGGVPTADEFIVNMFFR